MSENDTPAGGEPIANYDYVTAPPVWLIDGIGRRVFGNWGRQLSEYRNGELVELPASPMGWGHLIDGDWQPLKDFEPVEFEAVDEEAAIAQMML